jgi:geranylgeranyl pyrophosphate synthase
MRVFSWAVMEVVKGEMLRPMLSDDLDETERGYLAKIRGKTAALLAMCCETGAMLDAEDPATVGHLHAFGMNLGMAFQIVDDVLDYTATEEQLGKPVGSDLRQGTVTLPALYYLRGQPGDSAVSAVRGLLQHDESFQPDAAAAVHAIRQSAAVDKSMERAREYATRAERELDDVPESEPVQTLRRLAQYVVERHE